MCKNVDSNAAHESCREVMTSVGTYRLAVALVGHLPSYHQIDDHGLAHTMHACLYLEEILQQIFDQADYKSLTILATTCRLFYEPALNVIYSDLPGIEPLIKRLPQDLWSTSSGHW